MLDRYPFAILIVSSALSCASPPSPQPSAGSALPAASPSAGPAAAAKATAAPTAVGSSSSATSSQPPPSPSASTVPSSAPLAVSTSPSSRDSIALEEFASCEAFASCAVTPQGEVLCWAPDAAPVARALPLSNITSLVAGQLFHCTLANNGQVFCWGSYHSCEPLAAGARPTELHHGLGRVTRMFASGDVLCLSTAAGTTQCRRRPGQLDESAPWSPAPHTVAVTGNGCTLQHNGRIRCELGSREGLPPLGIVVFPGSFGALVEGGYNLGYDGVQHCALSQAGAVSCCTSLTACKSRRLERKKLPGPAVQLVGANNFVCARTKDGDVYCWPSTIMVYGLPFDSEPSGRVAGLSRTIEITGGDSSLCARFDSGQIACVGDGYGPQQPVVIRRAVAAPQVRR